MYSRFPLKKTLKSKDFYFDYIKRKNALLRNINLIELDKIINLLKKGLRIMPSYIPVEMVDLHRYQIILHVIL